MSFLTQVEIDNLQIMQFIFHIVQHEDAVPTLLAETPIGKFENFFLERVKATLKGNQFEFVPGSDTCRLLREISEDQDKFVDNSKQLAINFHASRSGRIKPGAIILMKLGTLKKELFSLIKYDREEVITYNLIKNDTRAVLQEITNSFTKSKNALQKSALIELTNQGGNLVVIDATVHYDITDFFKAFLNVRRLRSEEEMTQAVSDVVSKTTIKHNADLPRELVENVRSLAFDAIQSLDTFDEEEFFDKVFGSHGDPRIKQTYKTFLQKAGVEGESFKFEKRAIAAPRDKKYRTREGVRITVGSEAAGTVHIEYGKAKKPTVITIRTQQLIEE